MCIIIHKAELTEKNIQQKASYLEMEFENKNSVNQREGRKRQKREKEKELTKNIKLQVNNIIANNIKITLNVDGLYTPLKRQQSEWGENKGKTQLYYI